MRCVFVIQPHRRRAEWRGIPPTSLSAPSCKAGAWASWMSARHLCCRLWSDTATLDIILPFSGPPIRLKGDELPRNGPHSVYAKSSSFFLSINQSSFISGTRPIERRTHNTQQSTDKNKNKKEERTSTSQWPIKRKCWIITFFTINLKSIKHSTTVYENCFETRQTQFQLGVGLPLHNKPVQIAIYKSRYWRQCCGPYTAHSVIALIGHSDDVGRRC